MAGDLNLDPLFYVNTMYAKTLTKEAFAFCNVWFTLQITFAHTPTAFGKSTNASTN